jgi:hypothetical protein
MSLAFEGGTVYFIYNTPDGDPVSAIYSQREGNRHLFYLSENGDELYINKQELVNSEDLLKEDGTKYYILEEKKKEKVVTTPPRRAKPEKERRKKTRKTRRRRKSVRIY